MKLEALPWIILFLPLLATAVITLFTLHCKTKSSLISISAIDLSNAQRDDARVA